MPEIMLTDWFYWLCIAIYSATIISIIYIILKENRNPVRSLAWITVLFFLPVGNEKTCRSPHFHFPNTYENGRCVEYVKIDEEGNKIEILLNASNENVRVKGEGEILFARKFDGDILGANGTLIRKIGVTIQ